MTSSKRQVSHKADWYIRASRAAERKPSAGVAEKQHVWGDKKIAERRIGHVLGAYWAGIGHASGIVSAILS